MSERTSISVRALDALKGGVRERARVQVENDRLRGEVAILTRQRRELWMLLDHIDTLDDAFREHDDAFRTFTYKHQRRRFDIWDPGAASGKEQRMTQQVCFDTDDLSLKYDTILKVWPANTINIGVKRLTDPPVQHMITSNPESGAALLAKLEALHGEYGEAEYEIRFIDIHTKAFRGTGRIVMPDTRPSTEPQGAPPKTYDGMRADIREHKPLREGVRNGLTTLLVQARQIWGDETKHTLNEIAVRLMVGVGDVARTAREGEVASYVKPVGAHEPSLLPGAVPSKEDRHGREVKKELGNVLFSTIRWIDDLELDVLECLDLAIEAQEKFAQSGRTR